MFPRSNLTGLFLVWSHVTRRHVGDQAMTFFPQNLSKNRVKLKAERRGFVFGPTMATVTSLANQILNKP